MGILHAVDGQAPKASARDLAAAQPNPASVTQPVTIHICGGGEWSRCRMYCHWCMETRQAIRRLVFGGYGHDAVCGWCGTWYGDDEYHDRISESERDKNRKLVKEVWSRGYPAKPWKAAMAEVMASL